MTDENSNRKLPSKAVKAIAEKIEELSEEERQELFSTIQHIVKIEASTTIVSGPIPPPDMLDAYEKASPGSSRLIIEMARGQRIMARSRGILFCPGRRAIPLTEDDSPDFCEVQGLV